MKRLTSAAILTVLAAELLYAMPEACAAQFSNSSCGRGFWCFTVLSTLIGLLAHVWTRDGPVSKARYNVTPGTNILIVREDLEQGRVADSYRWGLIPGWSKDASIGNKLANARGETVAEKPSFRAAFKRWRCVVPASGFYEWKAVAGKKQPWYIRPIARYSKDFGISNYSWDIVE